jgi:hypothetical protein
MMLARYQRLKKLKYTNTNQTFLEVPTTREKTVIETWEKCRYTYCILKFGNWIFLVYHHNTYQLQDSSIIAISTGVFRLRKPDIIGFDGR